MAVWCVWLAVFVVCIGLEAASMALTSIWFAGGALAAFLLSLFHVSLEIQLLGFVIVSFVLPDGSVCRCFIPSFVFNKTIGTPVYQSEDGADQCGRAGG